MMMHIHYAKLYYLHRPATPAIESIRDTYALLYLLSPVGFVNPAIDLIY